MQPHNCYLLSILSIFKYLDNIRFTYSTVQSEAEQHEEKEYSPELSTRQRSDGFRIDLEHQTMTIGGYRVNGYVMFVRHVAEKNEDNEAAVEACEAVYCSGQKTISK